jgi:hypothetical protein
MKVSLSVLERLLVLNLLPTESNVVTLLTVRKAKELVGFTDEEQKKLEFKTENDRVTWKAVGDIKEFEIGERACHLVADALNELNKNKKLTENHLSLYEKFVGNDA